MLRPINSLLRTGFIAACIATAAAVALIASIPYMMANESIRERIRDELSNISGLPVQLNGGFSVSIFPTFTARFLDVEIGYGLDGKRSGMRAQTLEADLSWLAALSRSVQINDMRIDGADIQLVREEDGGFLSKTDARPLASILLAAKRAMATEPAHPDFSEMPANEIERLALTHSRLRVYRPDGDSELIADFSAQITWQGLAMPLRASGSGIWRGKELSFSGTVANPVLALAGGSTDVALSLNSDPVNFDFKGIANLEGFVFANGSLVFETTSMRNLLGWLGTEFGPGEAMGPLSMRAKLTTKDEHLEFSEAAINFNGNLANGVLDLTSKGSIPALSGTLAFNQLDLESFLAAFSISIRPEQTARSMSFLDQMDLDLRLSADTASIDDLRIAEVAAAVRVKDGVADFDLSDGSLLGGRVEAGLKITQTSGAPIAEIRARATELMLPSLPAGSAPWLAAPLQVAINLKGGFSGLPRFFGNAAGTAEIKIGKGVIENFDLAKFREGLDSGELFDLPVAYQGSAALNSASFSGKFINGAAVISEGTAELEGATFTFSGALPVLSQGLALSGTLSEPAGAQSPQVRRFFVGGSREQPFVTPVN